MDAVDRLSRFKEELKIRERKFELYRGGEEIFAFEHKEYPDLEKTKKEIKIASQLFDLYVDIIRTIKEWKMMPWASVANNIDDMSDLIYAYSGRCKKLPGRLREFDSFAQLKKKIEEMQLLLPLLQELSKDSIKARHWEQLMKICNKEFDVIGNPEFKLESLIDANLLPVKEEIEEITDGADKQLKIEQQLSEIKSQWEKQEFSFQEWKDRGIHVLKATPLVMEELEESQMNLQTMLTMRHVAPFRALAQDILGSLCETSDTLELWVKVQLMWCALESVFTGGDIAKQMPKEAKKFSKVDKSWAKIMINASECRNVVDACADELLRSCLPTMYSDLEKCQKSLEGYLEQKQNAFPRFYFVSNAKLLIILSQGSDPLAMNEYYENVFDAIQYVEHDKKDKTVIYKIHGSGGDGHEVIPFAKPVKAVGNIEDWLMSLLKNMRVTMKDLARSCAAGIIDAQNDLSRLRPLVDENIAQFALLGVQIMWTYETQNALESCQFKKNAMKENSQKQLQVLSEMSSWCLQDLGTKVNRKKIETLVTVHVHQRDIAQELAQLVRAKKVKDANDFDWLKQARFYWRPNSSDDVNSNGAAVVSITDVDFNYQYEYLGAKERLVITPLTDKCYITLAQALGMYYGGAPAGPAGTGKVRVMVCSKYNLNSISTLQIPHTRFRPKQ
jgi:dynein heavy chain